MTQKFFTADSSLFLKIGVTILATCYTILFFFLSIPRLLYPYEIDFFEGTVLEHALRIFRGKPVFTSPSISFVNLQYQPFYYYATAGAMHIFGVNYFSGRIVSFSSAIICAIIILYSIHKETRSWFYPFIGVSLFFAAYGVTGYWYELARVDMLMQLFLLGSMVSLLFWKNRFMIILSALFLVLGFFTKQQLPFYFVPAFVWLFLRDKRSAIIFAASSLIFLAAGFFLFTLDSGRWYFYFTFTLPGALSADQHWERMWGGVAGYVFADYAAGTLLLLFFWMSVWQS
jgi:4-amino-4-deoxy-L-arabinose transferase-like glycosyltransferase